MKRARRRGWLIGLMHVGSTEWEFVVELGFIDF